MRLFLRLALAAALLTLLLRSGRLELGALALFGKEPGLIVLCLLTYASAHVFLASFRWWRLAARSGIEMTLIRATQLQLSSYFVATTLPGAFSGDVAKGVLCHRDSGGRTGASVASVLLDRMSGLMALAAWGMFGVTTHFVEVWDRDELRLPVILLLASLLVLGGTVVAVSRVSMGAPGSRVQRWSSLLRAGTSWRAWWQSFLLSALLHGIILLYLMAIGRSVIGAELQLWHLAVAYPLASIVTAVPVSPAGLGVGHVVYEVLLQALGLAGGANLFHVYVTSRLLLDLGAGGLAFLSTRAGGHSPTGGSSRPPGDPASPGKSPETRESVAGAGREV